MYPVRPVQHYGSFYLRMGAVAFGIGSMIYSGLEFGQYFELERNTKCHNIMLALTPATRMAFIFIQMYFIFLNNEVSGRLVWMIYKENFSHTHTHTHITRYLNINDKFSDELFLSSKRVLIEIWYLQTKDTIWLYIFSNAIVFFKYRVFSISFSTERIIARFF